MVLHYMISRYSIPTRTLETHHARPSFCSMHCVVTVYECIWCRVGKDADSPMEELQVALDAMHAMQSTFYGRYMLASSVERRAGGQGLVQFATISGTADKVRSFPN